MSVTSEPESKTGARSGVIPAPWPQSDDSVRVLARRVYLVSVVTGVAIAVVGLVPSAPRGWLLPIVGCYLVSFAAWLAHVLYGFVRVVEIGNLLLESSIRREQSVADRLDRLTAMVESLGKSAPAGPDLKAEHLLAIRRATQSEHWDEADSLGLAFIETYPDDPHAGKVATELAEMKRAAGQDLLAKLNAAREVNDPDRVIELRDAAKRLVEPDALRALDRSLAPWFMSLIQRRMRTGKIAADVVALAGRVASSLDETSEGASLRASLPTLRRAVGLCPRCAQPYVGIDDACPTCLAGAKVPSPSVPT